MKNLSTIVVCCVGFLMLVGCEKASVQGKSKIEQRNRFPEIMVGRWEGGTTKSTWAFEFQPDGTILKMHHAMAGEVDLTQDGAYIVTDNPPISTEFYLAPCQAEYDPATNEVSIEVFMGYYKIQVYETVLEGNSTDIFKGPLSQDGKTWNAYWLDYFEIEGKKLKRETVKPRPIVFTKVDAQ
jgi:hypothetical protein